jgi:hypothetical protein
MVQCTSSNSSYQHDNVVVQPGGVPHKWNMDWTVSDNHVLHFFLLLALMSVKERQIFPKCVANRANMLHAGHSDGFRRQ